MDIVDRKTFREYFQPSRVVLIVVKAPNESGVNITTVAFNMHCSYEPQMFAFALEHTSYSCELLKRENECVMAVPGETMIDEVLFCGSQKGRKIDKAKELSIQLIKSSTHSAPSLEKAIGNVELVIEKHFSTGDHTTFIGRVVSYRVNKETTESCVLSIASNTRGYDLLLQQGSHRLASIKRSNH